MACAEKKGFQISMQVTNSPIRQLEFSVFTTQGGMFSCSLLMSISTLISASISTYLPVTCAVGKMRYECFPVLNNCSD